MHLERVSLMRLCLRPSSAISRGFWFSCLLASVVALHAEVIYLPLPGLEQAKQRASAIHCVDNLRRIVSAASFWALDNADQYPAALEAFTFELGDVSVLFCPADGSFSSPTNWTDLNWARISYEWVPLPDWSNPTQVCGRCKIHNNVAWAEGSVHELGGYHPGWPEIIAGPLEQYISPGSDARFQVRLAPDASSPLSFQWRRNTLYYVTNAVSRPDPENAGKLLWSTNREARFTVSALVGQTNQECILSAVTTNDSDFYSVAVSNNLGTAVSRETRLSVMPEVAAMAADPHWAEIICVNNLRQIGLLARLNRATLPDSLEAITNRFGLPLFGWPVALYCRADTDWTPALDWAGLDLKHTSYEMVPPDSLNPLAVYCRCKIHGFYLQSDGDVMWRPWFAGIQAPSDQTAQVNLRAFAGRTNVLEASKDLEHWEILASYGPDPGEFVYSEPRQVLQRFYRIRLE
jgi:hypothetical protein